MIIVLQQREHDFFSREGNDLFCTYTIGLTEALCGFHFTLKHLDGRDLLIKNPPGSVINPGMCRFILQHGKSVRLWCDGSSDRSFVGWTH